jgi:hypothetical protein
MQKNGTQTVVSVIPPCDICKHQYKRDTPAYADASMIRAGGSWAYLCKVHFAMMGCRLGLGVGQELVLGD